MPNSGEERRGGGGRGVPCTRFRTCTTRNPRCTRQTCPPSPSSIGSIAMPTTTKLGCRAEAESRHGRPAPYAVKTGRPSGEHRRPTGRAALRPRSSAISPQDLTWSHHMWPMRPCWTPHRKNSTSKAAATARQYCTPRDNTSSTVQYCMHACHSTVCGDYHATSIIIPMFLTMWCARIAWICKCISCALGSESS